MSYWNGKETITSPTVRVDGKPDWLRVDCYCCSGYKWQYGEPGDPEDCDDCGGRGSYYVHIPSRRIALHGPGGPFHGSMTETDLARELEAMGSDSESRPRRSGAPDQEGASESSKEKS